MTNDAITGIVRAILAAIGGFLISKGYSETTWNWIAGGALTAATMGWSWWTNRPAGLAGSAQKLDGVNVQVSPSASPAVAQAVSDAKASS